MHEADTDGNPETSGDPNWTPLHFTYPMPDHDSAHSVEGARAPRFSNGSLARTGFVSETAA
jgi:hypothetical protein